MDRSQKQKKVTVKFFLNKAVDPVLGEKREKHYPLYVQVTYNRKNLQFRSYYGEYYNALEEVKPALLRFEEKIIHRIISYEAGATKSEYELKGLKRKYSVYSMSVLSAVEAYLKPKLRLSVLKTESELSHALNFTEERVTTGVLYKAARLLFPDLDKYVGTKFQEELIAFGRYAALYKGPILAFNFPTIIEWLDGSYKEALATQLEEPDSIILLLNQAIKQSLKALDG